MAEVCMLCEMELATTTWGFPVCDACAATLDDLAVDLRAMEAVDPSLAELADRVDHGWEVIGGWS